MGNRKNKRSTVQVRGIAKSRKLTRIQTNKKPELSDDILEVDNRPRPKQKPDFEDGINTKPTAGISLMIAALQVILHLKLKLKWIIQSLLKIPMSTMVIF